MGYIDIFYEFPSPFDQPIRHFRATIFHKTSETYAIVITSEHVRTHSITSSITNGENENTWSFWKKHCAYGFKDFRVTGSCTSELPVAVASERSIALIGSRT